VQFARAYRVGIGLSEWRRFLGFRGGSSIETLGLVTLLTVVQVLAIVTIPRIVEHEGYQGVEMQEDGAT
jgi:hypothetical protein